MFAQAIHAASPRASEPFIPVNCGAIPKDLVESELLSADEPAPKALSDVGKWRYDPALGRAVRYGTTPVVDTGRRRERRRAST